MNDQKEFSLQDLYNKQLLIERKLKFLLERTGEINNPEFIKITNETKRDIEDRKVNRNMRKTQDQIAIVFIFLFSAFLSVLFLKIFGSPY